MTTTTTQSRDSRFELLRILAMLAIIAHHYVVNSTVMAGFSQEHISPQQYFLTLWGMWGKTAINSFVLISGYFLCMGNLTWQRWVKLFLQALFYNIAILIVFCIAGRETLSFNTVVGCCLFFLRDINNSFTASFLAFYAFVPVYNRFIQALDHRMHLRFILGLLLLFTVADTFFSAHVFHEPFWYITLYFMAAYIRLYPHRYTDSLRLSLAALVAFVAIAMVGTLLLASAGRNPYFLVANSDKLLALLVSLAAFLTAKNLIAFHSRTLNFLSAGTFGVLLIHTASDTMRHWLWQDLLHVPNQLYDTMPHLLLHALLVPPAVFLLCSLIDSLRRHYLERPHMNWMSKMK